MQAKDSVFNQEKERQIHKIYFNEKLRQQELEAQNKKYKSQNKIYLLARHLDLVVGNRFCLPGAYAVAVL